LKPTVQHQATVFDAESLSRFMSCPIILDEPDRLVYPPSWLAHIPFAFWIVDALRPGVFVELGTHSGNSYAAFAQAIQRLGLPTAGYAVDTWRGDPQAGIYDEGVFTDWSEYHDRRFSGFSRLVRSTFAEAVEHFPNRGVDLLHIDGYHTFEAVSADFELWRPKMSDRGVVLMHDINVRENAFGAWRFWELVKEQHPSFAFLHGYGLGVLGLGADLPESVTWLLSRASADSNELAAIRTLFARLGGAVASRFAERTLRAEVGEVSAQLTGVEAELERLRDLHAQEVDDLRLQLKDREEQLRVRASHLDQLGLEVSEIREQRRVLESLAHNAREIDRLRQQVAQFEASHSWRLTAPLRRAARAARLVWRRRFAEEAQESAGADLVFDAKYYLERYPEAAESGLDPVADYFQTGWREHRNPHPIFDTDFYLQRYPDVAASGMNPLVHYVTVGAREGRDPHPLFQSRYYLDQNPDVAASGINPLVHFVRFGGAEGRDPHPCFDSSYYLARYPDVAAAHLNPLIHFVTLGAAERRDPNDHFVTAFYVQENPDAAAPESNPLVHYVQIGQRNGRRCYPPTPAPMTQT
jgi:hypothetical protein